MRTIDVPIFPQNDEAGEFMVFLPDVSSTSPENVSFEVDADERLVVSCQSQSLNGETEEMTFGIEINEANRDLIDEIESLTVVNPAELNPETFTDDPSIQEELKGLFDYLDEHSNEQ